MRDTAGPHGRPPCTSWPHAAMTRVTVLPLSTAPHTRKLGDPASGATKGVICTARCSRGKSQRGQTSKENRVVAAQERLMASSDRRSAVGSPDCTDRTRAPTPPAGRTAGLLYGVRRANTTAPVHMGGDTRRWGGSR